MFICCVENGARCVDARCFGTVEYLTRLFVSADRRWEFRLVQVLAEVMSGRKVAQIPQLLITFGFEHVPHGRR